MRKISFIWVMILIWLSPFSLQAQDQPVKVWSGLLQVEGGIFFPRNSIREDIPIRQTVSHAYPGAQGHVTATNMGLHAALKWEGYNQQRKVGFATGIRYSTFITDITGSVAYNINYFYLRYGVEGADARFARVTNISEESHFLGLPLEIRYAPLEKNRVHYYIKGGIEPIYRLMHRNNIHFHNQEMNAHKETVVEAINNPVDAFNAKIYGAFGLSLHLENGGQIAGEVLFASSFLRNEVFSLTQSEGFSGIRLSYSIPFKK